MLGVLSIGWRIVLLIVFLVVLSMHYRIVLSIVSVIVSTSLVWEAPRVSLGPRAPLWVALGVYLDADSWNWVLDAFCL